MATSSAPITTLLLSNKNTHNYKKFNDDGRCSFLLRHTNLHRLSSTRPSNKDLVVRRATPEVAGDLLSSFSLPTIPGFEDNPWLVGVCGLVVGLPLMIQKLVSLSKQLDAAAQKVENIADTVERVPDEVDKAAEGLKEALPEGKLKEVAAYVEKLAENTSDGADMISDVMDMVEEIDDKLEAFPVRLQKQQAAETAGQSKLSVGWNTWLKEKMRTLKKLWLDG